MLLQRGGSVIRGETPAVLAFGQAAFQAMTLVVNMKILFVQRVRRTACLQYLVGYRIYSGYPVRAVCLQRRHWFGDKKGHTKTWRKSHLGQTIIYSRSCTVHPVSTAVRCFAASVSMEYGSNPGNMCYQVDHIVRTAPTG